MAQILPSSYFDNNSKKLILSILILIAIIIVFIVGLLTTFFIINSDELIVKKNGYFFFTILGIAFFCHLLVFIAIQFHRYLVFYIYLYIYVFIQILTILMNIFQECQLFRYYLPSIIVTFIIPSYCLILITKFIFELK